MGTTREGWAKDAPNPGSDEAVRLGCTCAIMDNHHGRGMTSGYGTPEEPAFWITEGCPLHAVAREEDDRGA